MLKYEKLDIGSDLYSSSSIDDELYYILTEYPLIVESLMTEHIIYHESLNKHIIHYQKTEGYLYNER
nr:MAG TPA: hypothetical protein [Caudoviricetes sp.]